MHPLLYFCQEGSSDGAPHNFCRREFLCVRLRWDRFLFCQESTYLQVYLPRLIPFSKSVVGAG